MKSFKKKYFGLLVSLAVALFFSVNQSMAGTSYVGVNICSSVDTINPGDPVTISWSGENTPSGWVGGRLGGNCTVSANLLPIPNITQSGNCVAGEGKYESNPCAYCRNGATVISTSNCGYYAKGGEYACSYTYSCPDASYPATSDSKTFYPTATTTYSVTCSNSWGAASASVTVNVNSVDNGCAADTCKSSDNGQPTTCFNGSATVNGTKLPDKRNECRLFLTGNLCLEEENCGKMLMTKKYACKTIDYNFCMSETNCSDPCPDPIMEQCPGCQLEIKRGGWIEVAP